MQAATITDGAGVQRWPAEQPPALLRQWRMATISIPGPVQLKARMRALLIELLTREQGTPVDYDHPPGDAGLFGPRSVTWQVHADFPGMMAGGVCALMLQTLHPKALAGVWDHSDFRHDLLGRLRRTTAFVAGTSYAPKAEAERLIAQVAQILRVERDDIVEVAEILAAHLAALIARNVDAVPLRHRDRALVGRMADMPRSGPRRIYDDIHPRPRSRIAHRRLGQRRAADIAEAYKQNGRSLHTTPLS